MPLLGFTGMDKRAKKSLPLGAGKDNETMTEICQIDSTLIMF